ncbi:uncharacterized protein LOC130677176 [Microplitis mediator]|uniref:uncharacterized protein LOC130677176 n=1 Tax=Microplitis mediator TaxID=375433 RepID=UPI002553DC24|nr:uncharacterized protein LOC130677176 [Microplitis mediator]
MATENIPQWKRDLIQRRKNKPSNSTSNSNSNSNSHPSNPVTSSHINSNINSQKNISSSIPSVSASDNNNKRINETILVKKITAGAGVGSTATETELTSVGSVACTMRLEPDVCLVPFTKNSLKMSNKSKDCESDSSEELQYGPGIVNRLKSKYLNLTREINNSNFRRAASLEDLLDCESDKRKFIKKSGLSAPGSGLGVAVKTERFRNANRGNESMKRARSVETLMRYDDKVSRAGENDHIVLVDRTVKIESRLEDRPRLLKPKRLKPVVAETERPPPDLVKTTMRIFESSVKKIKPKGEVAIKVATFKTINDNFKAQGGKKIQIQIQKPAIQPKPCGRVGKTIQNVKDDKDQGVVLEKIVKVSTVVSKFQQIADICSPSISPEPKIKNFESGTKSFEPVPKNMETGTRNFEVGIKNCEPEVREIKNEEEIEEVKEVDGRKKISKNAMENISNAGETLKYNFNDNLECKNYLPILVNGTQKNDKSESGEKIIEVTEVLEVKIAEDKIEEKYESKIEARIEVDTRSEVDFVNDSRSQEGDEGGDEVKVVKEVEVKGAISSGKTGNKVKEPVAKQIGVIRPLVSTKSLSNREMEKNLINRVKSIESEQPTKVVVSLKTAEEIGKKNGTGLWDKPWNQQNNTMVFNFSNRKDVPDYIENDGLIIRRKREKSKGEGIIVLDATLDASTTDDGDWELSGGPPSPCDVAFSNDNILINGRSNLSRSPRNHKHRIQFDDTATRTFEYPSEASMLEDEGSCVDGETTSGTATGKSESGTGNGDGDIDGDGVGDMCGGLLTTELSQTQLQQCNISNAAANPILGGGGLASFTPTKMDLTAKTFELGVTRSPAPPVETHQPVVEQSIEEAQDLCADSAAWGAEATADLLY